MRSASLALLLSLVALPLFAAPPAAVEDVSRELEAVRAQFHMPAMAAAVWRGGTLVATGVTGVRKVGDTRRATVSDQWHLGSDTKAMTATLAGILVERGSVRLEDTVSHLFAGERIDPGWSHVTLLQLLQHRGGAPGDVPDAIWSRMWDEGRAPEARIHAVRALLSRPPAQSPGTFVYANAGYMIAGVALERASGLRWEQLIERDLFAPLGMTSCGFGAPDGDEPWGHERKRGDRIVPVAPGPQADNPPSMGPAGTVHCSLADWGRFLAVHLAGARGEDTPVLRAATLARLQTPPPGGEYAAGWGVTTRPWAGGTALTHSGSNTVWYATAWLAPARNLTLAVVTNCGGDAAEAAVDAAFAPLIKRFAR
jgi:D-alanyl-D-alanine carboxypeptidase